MNPRLCSSVNGSHDTNAVVSLVRVALLIVGATAGTARQMKLNVPLYKIPPAGNTTCGRGTGCALSLSKLHSVFAPSAHPFETTKTFFDISASFPGPHTTFGCMKEHGGPGMLPHMHDIKGRKVIERTKLNVGELALRIARRAKVQGNLPHVSS